MSIAKVALIFILLLCISLNGLIIYYLYNLEGETCNCVLDWRHNYLKYSTFIIVLLLLTIKKSINYIIYIYIIISLLVIVNGFVFNDYIIYLETSKCNCAIYKQKKLHTFLYYFGYIFKYISKILIPVVLISIYVLHKT